ncbi:prephenate dehydrogenase [Lipingzhangella sp. LS1_29]|uniref:Prephenate dehydrogenase n=1 Tax=Lipingzhangella rawalii TaxID=2055835 RepID=A0ABU2H1Z5_9ACTN|nr:prephenate dehydrogenase [Lipingzhangella rawalii]MDS1269311.1 prephenate dehydrogenase [Lipingzhangella rawalii]
MRCDDAGVVAVRRVLVLGAGLIGTSIALALREHDVDVLLSDPDPAAVSLACDLGAGEPVRGWFDSAAGDDGVAPADLAIVAAPPAAVPGTLRSAQDRGVAHVYTDVASVKTWVVEAARTAGCDMTTYVPGHPMGGRERGGAGAARADLFLGRSWALCESDKTDPTAVRVVTELVAHTGAHPVRLSAQEHDRAVALVSHAPHMAAAAVAARLSCGDSRALGLAGQGVRDVTRIAAGDPQLWTEIVGYNAASVAGELSALAADLEDAAAALRETGANPRRADGLHPVRDLLLRGQAGQERLPAKHGFGRDRDYTVVPVVIPDEPGSLARLFQAAGAADVNIEDVRLDHSPGLPVGLAQLWVVPEAGDQLRTILAAQGWSVHA